VILERYCKQHGWTLEKEYRFHPTRRWRGDYAILEPHIIIECEGGAYVRGRHVRGTGYVKDMQKYREAFVLGWSVIRFTPQEIERGEHISVLERWRQNQASQKQIH